MFYIETKDNGKIIYKSDNETDVIKYLEYNPSLDRKKYNIVLVGANLRGENFSYMDLSHIDFRCSTFRMANLEHSSLKYCDLRYTELRTNLSKTSLTGAKFN